jgi:hypothetical protein
MKMFVSLAGYSCLNRGADLRGVISSQAVAVECPAARAINQEL